MKRHLFEGRLVTLCQNHRGAENDLRVTVHCLIIMNVFVNQKVHPSLLFSPSQSVMCDH